MNLIEKAQQLAHEAHDFIGQRRKYTHENYWVHTDSVARMGYNRLMDMAGLALMDIHAVVAGYHLHDYREDVVTELKRLGNWEALAAFEARYNEFPELTKATVTDLTDVYVKADFPKLNRRERHALENKRLVGIAPLSKVGKLCDMIDNTKSIVPHDPDFARVYLLEKKELLHLFADSDPVLLAIAWEQVKTGLQMLN